MGSLEEGKGWAVATVTIPLRMGTPGDRGYWKSETNAYKPPVRFMDTSPSHTGFLSSLGTSVLSLPFFLILLDVT